MAGEYPNYYATQAALGNASTAALSIDPGFLVKSLRLENFEAVDFYVNMKGNAATTLDFFLRSCGGKLEMANLAVPLRTLSAYTTSTGAANKLLRVLALG